MGSERQYYHPDPTQFWGYNPILLNQIETHDKLYKKSMGQ
jgi:hypothetical protein